MIITIRHAIETDATVLADIAQQTFALACPPESHPKQIQSYAADKLCEAAFVDMLLSGERITVASVDGAIAGFCVLSAAGDTPPCVDKMPAIELSKLYLKAEFHGWGIAQQLMQDAVVFAAAERYQSMWLGVFSGNEGAQGFYSKSGFRATGSCYFEMGSERHLDNILVLALD